MRKTKQFTSQRNGPLRPNALIAEAFQQDHWLEHHLPQLIVLSCEETALCLKVRASLPSRDQNHQLACMKQSSCQTLKCVVYGISFNYSICYSITKDPWQY